jgi:hypothetical protein
MILLLAPAGSCHKQHFETLSVAAAFCVGTHFPNREGKELEKKTKIFVRFQFFNFMEVFF